MNTAEEANKIVERSENFGRHITETLCNKLGWEYENCDELYKPYDCFITIDGKRHIGEIKVRDIKFATKPTLHFEVKKYNNLLVEADKENVDGILYINWLGNECYVFDVTDELIMNSRMIESFSNRVTAMSRLDEDKVYKEMYLLPKRLARRHVLRDYDRIVMEIQGN